MIEPVLGVPNPPQKKMTGREKPEGRRHVRKRALLGARILFNSGRSSIDATVRDISDGGARLLVETPIGIPDQFILAFNDEGRFDRACAVAWRKGNQIGVRFE